MSNPLELLDTNITCRFSCNISYLSDDFKICVKEKMSCISGKDILPGKFLVWTQDNQIILYKVVSISDANSFFIIHNNSTVKVVYINGLEGDIFCYAPEIMKRFTNTISNHDLLQAIEIYENIKIQMNEISSSPKKSVSFDQGLTRTPSIKSRRFAKLGPFDPLPPLAPLGHLDPLAPLGPLGQNTQGEKSVSCCAVI